MAFVTRIFGAIDRTFLARAYVISFAIAGFMVWVQIQAQAQSEVDTTPNFSLYAITLVNALLFPFAKLVWNELRDFLMGGNFVVANAILVFGLKFIVNFTLFGLAVFIAPVGVAYLWFRTRSA